MFGLVVFGVLSAICGAAPNENWLIVARVVQGIGAALIFPVSIAVVSSTFTGARQSAGDRHRPGLRGHRHRARSLRRRHFSEYLELARRVLHQHPFCIAAIVLMLRYVKESRDESADRHIDCPGMITVTAGWSHQPGVRSRRSVGLDCRLATLGTFAAGLVLLVVFVMIESRVRSPLIDLALFRNRAFDAVVLAGSLSNVVFCLVAVFSALYLQQARGLSPFNSGLVFLALSAGAGSASYFSGRLAESFPPIA